jgi:ABC-2 type transport system permease protein
MNVYKAFYKIVLKNLPQLMIYIVVFISIAVLFSKVSPGADVSGFTETKVRLAFINEDENSLITKGLQQHLQQKATLMDIAKDDESLQDALFFREVEYIVIVPKGFSESFLAGEEANIYKRTVPDSTNGIYMDLLIDGYLNTAKIYTEVFKDATPEEILMYIEEDLNKTIPVELMSMGQEDERSKRITFYFNYISYALFSILILGLSMVMLVFNQEDLKRRNHCTPMQLKSMNAQMLLGIITFGVIVWGLLMGVGGILYGGYLFTTKGLLLMLNAFVFMLVVLSISYFLTHFIKGKNAMSAVANVFALGTSFIGGVFVPQELLADHILKVAAFTPTYWFVKSNRLINALGGGEMEYLMPIFINLLILVGFAVTICIVTLVVIKQKRMSR